MKNISQKNVEILRIAILENFKSNRTLTIFFIDNTITLLFEAILSGWLRVGSDGFGLDMLAILADGP